MPLFIILSLAPYSSFAWQVVNEQTQPIAAEKPVSTEQIDKQHAIKIATTTSSNNLLKQLQTTTRDSFTVELPGPNASLASYLIQPSSEISAQLQSDYPTIRSFKGHRVGDPTQLVRVSTGPNGFHAMYIIDGTLWYLDPDNDGQYQLYTSQSKHKHDRMLVAEHSSQSRILARGPLSSSPGIITYRLAVATTGEYTRFFGSKEKAFSAIVTTINRVNLLFERDLAIQLELIDNNDLLIFTDASTDPFENDDPDADIAAAQQTIDNRIGSNNYDLGHVFATDGGGLAQVGAVCRSGFKAQAMTGTPRPLGDAFNVDFVAHEIGHQLGAVHTFNGTAGFCEDGRIENSAFELGGGVTIMGYAGICSDGNGDENVRSTSIGTFHYQSINEIHNYVRFSGGRNCGVHQDSVNVAPIVDAGENKTIPIQTPFLLTGTASDENQDTLIYTWEQYDLGTPTTDKSDWSISGDGPLFRNYPASSSTTRYLPDIQDIIFGRASAAEILPTQARQLTFKFVAKDQKGGVSEDETKINVRADAGPFVVTSPVANQTFSGREVIDVHWQVNATDKFCSQVDILLNSDLNDTFEYVLLERTANDGHQQLLLPNISAPQAKIMVKCTTQPFFNLNPGFFAIEKSLQPIISGQLPFSVDQGQSFSITISDLIVDNPSNSELNLQVLSGNSYTVAENVITANNPEQTELMINLQVSDGIETSNTFVFLAQISSVEAPTPEPDPEPADVNINIKAGSSGTINLYLLMLLTGMSLLKRYQNSLS
ncbi:reprolysin-like metallopeptidase [Catenovulum agarivorans]|uniref:reprolysin-like metallopeptidase n=1 Tax=Catenovulum agarivorans TaxID=1172192 RepID=UPI001268B965|nr:zinc-dependent metalloprotease family protein [Catenovulum agarivorans]